MTRDVTVTVTLSHTCTSITWLHVWMDFLNTTFADLSIVRYLYVRHQANNGMSAISVQTKLSKFHETGSLKFVFLCL